jgi:HPt (histidine-containing phosphotransfer) domain-containing protein
MSDGLEEFHRQQKLLREKFAVRAQDDAEQFERMGQEMASRPEILEDIKSLAHRMAGTAGTFGFNELTAPAAELEQAIIDNLSIEDITQHLKNLVAQIRDINTE